MTYGMPCMTSNLLVLCMLMKLDNADVVGTLVQSDSLVVDMDVEVATTPYTGFLD